MDFIIGQLPVGAEYQLLESHSYFAGHFAQTTTLDAKLWACCILAQKEKHSAMQAKAGNPCLPSAGNRQAATCILRTPVCTVNIVI